MADYIKTTKVGTGTVQYQYIKVDDILAVVESVSGTTNQKSLVYIATATISCQELADDILTAIAATIVPV